MKNGMIRKATKSFVGRALRRLLGEEKGVVMMEYIVVALLIAAACVIAVAFFGHTITGMFGSLSSSVTGDVNKAAEEQNKLQNNQDANNQAAQAHNTGKHAGGGNTEGNQEFSNK